VTGRALALVVRLLPGHRRDWGEAMRAEFAAIEGGAARRRHALGCVRAVLFDRGALRTLVVHAVALGFAAAVLVLAFDLRSIGVQVETFVLLAVLGGVAWTGRRRGVADEPVARRFRGAGYAVVGAGLLLLLTGPGGNGDPGGWWVAGLAFVLCLSAVVVVTARGVSADTLRVVAAVAVAGVAAWWVPMLVLDSVRAHPQWALAIVVACSLVAARLAPDAEVAALATAFASCLLIFVVAVGTYAAFPGLAPDIAAAQAVNPALENQIESTDPYIGELLLGALLGLALIGAARIRKRPPGLS
jgi:hypothetical protein